jgi:hypothetical protein
VFCEEVSRRVSRMDKLRKSLQHKQNEFIQGTYRRDARSSVRKRCWRVYEADCDGAGGGSTKPNEFRM